jgi:hypothetical protein
MMKNLRTSSLAAFGFAALLLTGACASTSNNDDMTSASTADQTIQVQTEGNVANAENIGTNEASVPSITGGITATGAPLDIEQGAVSTTVNTGNTSVDNTLSTGTTTQTHTTTVTQGSMTSSSTVDDDDDDTATAARTRMRKD